MEEPFFKCTKCRSIIPHCDIDIINSTNEEGEEYGRVVAECPVCKEDHEARIWGYFDSLTEAIESLNDFHYPKPSPEIKPSGHYVLCSPCDSICGGAEFKDTPTAPEEQ